MAEEVDTSRTTVRTYVPAYQRDEWDDHAEELDMSRSEFVKAMVQAGRRGFGASRGDGSSGPETETGEKADDPGSNPRGDGLEEQVLDVLAKDDYLSWEELVEELTGDLESRLERALQDLQSDDRVRYSGPNGGYTIDE